MCGGCGCAGVRLCLRTFACELPFAPACTRRRRRQTVLQGDLRSPREYTSTGSCTDSKPGGGRTHQRFGCNHVPELPERGGEMHAIRLIYCAYSNRLSQTARNSNLYTVAFLFTWTKFTKYSLSFSLGLLCGESINTKRNFTYK